MKPFLDIDSSVLLEHFKAFPVVTFRDKQVISDVAACKRHVLIVRSGTVRVSMLSAAGNERLFYFASAGCVIGDTMCFGTDADVCAGLRAMATGQCEAVRVRQEDFQDACRSNPSLLLSALAIAHRKLTIAIEQLEYATFEDTTCQLVDLLQAISQANSVHGDGHFINMTHQDLANATGRTRVSITNALSRLQVSGAVRLNRGRIEVVDNPQAVAKAGRNA